MYKLSPYRLLFKRLNLIGLVFGLIVLWNQSVLWADVGGSLQVLYRQHQLFGGAVSTGNTLMSASLNNPLVNSRLLSSSPGDVQGIPFDAQLQGAYLFWSGSTLNTSDNAVDLTLPDGTVLNEVTAERCFDINAFGGFFYCRADVTQQVRMHAGSQNYNGQYVVGDLRAEPGTLQGNGSCVEPQECQAKYAAWSLILVYSSASSTVLRDVSIYDGFLQLDETSQSPGVASFTLSGFDFPESGQASLAFFGMEGDALLGVPPQDTDSNANLRCDTCFDFFEVNGNKLSDANNPANNLFNSSSVIGFTLGVDLDVFDISNFLSPGSSQINIRVGSGDGRVNPMAPDPGGGGELFLLGYMMFSVDRNAPNFSRDGTTFTVFPDEAAPLERVVLNLRIQNEGSLSAQNVNTRVNLPNGLTYFPGSLRIDGVDPIPGNEVDNPLANGFNLGSISFQNNSRRDIVLRASIDDNVAAGTRLRSTARISANNLMEDRTLEAIVTVLGTPPLTRPTKEVNGNDGDNTYSPGEIIQYSITIPNENNRPLSGVRLVDQVPPYVDVLQVITSAQNISDLSRNQVIVEGINIPANQSNEVIIIAQVHSAEQLIADGVPAGQIDGWSVSNQAEISLGSEVLLSDDPNTGSNADATVFLIDAGVDIRGSGTRKSVTDVNGGSLEPGDELIYSIRVRNTGASAGIISIDDVFPALLSECTILTPVGTLACNGAAGSFRIRGDAEIEADDLVRVDFSTRVSIQANDGDMIQNIAEISVTNDDQNVTIRSPQLQVVARENLQITKIAQSGITVEQGGRVTYAFEVRNLGNRIAQNVQIRDPINFAVSDVIASDGGQFIVNSSEVLWDLTDVQPGESKRFTLTLTLDPSITAGRVLSNQALLNSDDLLQPLLSDDPQTSQASDPTLVTVQGMGARLALSKQPSVRNVQAGAPMTYTLTVRNIGDVVVSDISVDDPLPDGRFSIRTTEQGIVRGNRVIFNASTEPALASLAPGESIDLLINTVISALIPGSRIRNQARVIAVGIDELSDDPDTNEPQDATFITVIAPPQVELLKQVEDLNGGAFEPGDLVRYTLQLTVNNGVLDNVLMQDPIPAGLSNIVPLDAGTIQGQSIQWALGDIGTSTNTITVRFEAEIASRAIH